ncbi:MAG: hypothetical protein QM778_17295 [Myxococcales bacterium]
MEVKPSPNTLSKNWIFVVGVLIGCAVGAVVGVRAEDKQIAFKPVTSFTPWQQFCHRHAGLGFMDEANEEIVKYGSQGWELVSASVDYHSGLVHCYKRPFK